jgi:hypothetical protein
MVRKRPEKSIARGDVRGLLDATHREKRGRRSVMRPAEKAGLRRAVRWWRAGPYRGGILSGGGRRARRGASPLWMARPHTGAGADGNW